MHINCHQDDLLYGVQIASKAVSNKNTQPILTGMLLKVENNKLNFCASDDEIMIECAIDIDVIEEGSIVVPGKYFTDIVKKLPNTLVNIKSMDNYGLLITYGESELFINGLSPEEFPNPPEIDDHIQGSINQNILKKMIKQTSIAVAHDEVRPVFSGIFFELIDEKITMVATDTHRLALKKGEWQGTTHGKTISMIIPAKTMLEISRIISDQEEPINLVIGENQISFDLGNILFISRLIEGQYPNYRQVIPDTGKYNSKIRFQRKKLLEIAERASLFIQEDLKEKMSVIKLTITNEVIEINSKSQEMGSIYEKLPAFLEGEPTEINLNAHYLVDALRSVESEEIYMELTGALSPGIIKEVNSDSYIYLILPIRTL